MKRLVIGALLILSFMVIVGCQNTTTITPNQTTTLLTTLAPTTTDVSTTADPTTITPTTVVPTTLIPSTMTSTTLLPTTMAPTTLLPTTLPTTSPTTTALVVTESVETYLAGTLDEFSIYKYETNVPGPTFFIIGGIHGNERAGWMAGLQMRQYPFERGVVYVLPVANKRAATAEPPVRYVSGLSDLNRAFPGNASGTTTQKLAHVIFQAIASCEPDIVLDLHESRFSYDSGGLGDSIILHLPRYSLYLDSLLYEFNHMAFMADKQPFTNLNAPPTGSINKEFSNRYNIPVFTIETNRNTPNNTIESEINPLEDRIEQQLAFIKLFLDTFELS